VPEQGGTCSTGPRRQFSAAQPQQIDLQSRVSLFAGLFVRLEQMRRKLRRATMKVIVDLCMCHRVRAGTGGPSPASALMHRQAQDPAHPNCTASRGMGRCSWQSEACHSGGHAWVAVRVYTSVRSTRTMDRTGKGQRAARGLLNKAERRPMKSDYCRSPMLRRARVGQLQLWAARSWSRL